METIRLDGKQLCRREKAMELLGQTLALPEWWGRNLDALHDCLTEVSRPVRLELYDCEGLKASFFGRRLLKVLTDSAAENPYFELILR